MKKAIFAGLALVALIQSAAAQEPTTTYIHAGRLLADPASGRVETNKTIVVTAGKIAEIRDGFVGEGKIVDLRDQFVLPGFIDSHVHLTFESSPTSRLDAVTKSTVDQAFDGVVFAKRTVRAGFTTVVDLGADPQAINALRDATATGKVVGPRIIAAGGVAAHGGHGDVHGYRQEIIDLFRSPTLCSGADDCARAVRLAVQQGADVIKTASTGGVMSNTAAGLGQQMSDAELVAIVDTAHRLGRKVAAHAHGTDGVNAALRAGVDSVEHGTYLDAESIRLFKAKGSYLVPTLLAGDTVARQAETADWMPAPVRAKARTVGPLMVDALRRAHQGGVRIAFGTDSAVSAHGDNAREFALMVKAGLTPLETIKSATVWAATHAGLETEIGTLAAGKSADIVAVKGDPLTDVRSLETMGFVMARGVVVRAAGE
ncbi:Xaa-Pro dipeptidase [Sphingopyxis sp. Root214]|uniref:metal-dependent hydrolase family protein n=1 Tax=unclassified Sphingopyxis TaxID=2614943 RepID=UPI0007018D0D|nr:MULTISPECIES: amidohydrolase family protein [unclassified Sphingopyxis]KQZ69029.1 Xaa-Pro dipeptidase [Sphingopyxis sp. Root154]KRC10348.1 Xaa-Pro dipeptidase [Sphingopyxis sp. Root214]